MAWWWNPERNWAQFNPSTLKASWNPSTNKAQMHKGYICKENGVHLLPFSVRFTLSDFVDDFDCCVPTNKEMTTGVADYYNGNSWDVGATGNRPWNCMYWRIIIESLGVHQTCGGGGSTSWRETRFLLQFEDGYVRVEILMLVSPSIGFDLLFTQRYELAEGEDYRDINGKTFNSNEVTSCSFSGGRVGWGGKIVNPCPNSGSVKIDFL